MKEMLINKINKGYTIKLYNNIYKNNKYVKNEVLEINSKTIFLKTIDGVIHNIKKDTNQVINNIIENTLYSENFKLCFYRDYKINNIIVIKFESNL